MLKDSVDVVEAPFGDVCKVVGKWKARDRKLGLTTQERSEAEHLF
jgi:hypothetical protein